MILRVSFKKGYYLKYISHLDLIRLFKRTFNRCGIPINHSEGFNPQPKFSIANPLALGIASDKEYMDIELYRRIDVKDFKEKMNEELPKGIKITDAKYVQGAKSISSSIDWGLYQIQFNIDGLMEQMEFQNRINTWLNREDIIIERIRYRRGRTVKKEQNIKPLIGGISIENFKDHGELGCSLGLKCLLKAGDRGNLRPTDLIEAMERYLDIVIDPDSLNIRRLQLFGEEKGEIIKLM